MPSKTSSIRPKGAFHGTKSGDHPRKTAAGTSKPTEGAATSISFGPKITVSLSSTAPAAAGKTYLEALQAGRKSAAPAAAIPVVEPATEEPQKASPVVESTSSGPVEPEVRPSAIEDVPPPSQEEEQQQEPPPQPEAEEKPKEEEPLPAAEPQLEASAAGAAAAAAAVVPSAGSAAAAVPFSWATDTDDDINFQFHQPSPQFAAGYPAGVLENRAHNVAFKVPAPGQTLAGAMAELLQERQGLLAERRELDRLRTQLQDDEAALAKLRHQLQDEGEKLQQQRAQLLQQQEELQQAAPSQAPPAPSQAPSQGAMLGSPTPSPGAPPATAAGHVGPKRGYAGAPDYGGAQRDWSPSQQQDWAPSMGYERWATEMGTVPNYEIYGVGGGFPQQRPYNYRSTAPAGMGQQLRAGPPGRMSQAQLQQHHMGGGVPLQHFNNARMTTMPGGRPPMDAKTLNIVNRNPIQQQPFNGYNKTW